MKNFFIIGLIGLFALAACSSKDSETKALADATASKTNSAYGDLSVITASGGETGLSVGEAQAFYVNYMQLRGYLVESDGRNAQAAAEYMSEDLRGIKGEYAEDIVANIDIVKNTQNVDEQRVAFEKLSNILYEVLKVVKVIDTPIYVQHCPMAFGDNGATWLSEKKEISNPYFGDAMLSCGTNQAVIAAN
jgi:hypothetical protein